ncbi:excalibur calcium-binding domain-containing protein [Nocardioides sp. TRM66260-LWL]|uniref:excalibur calcium-binding domain-containing protein n=1 Tax=Nocardioides sp. TRM66260-LWL TaxID=2874478 RepID=UPI001CC6F303|nr:excalibur calcium-binding domain-containing protein [Nocardioides sp. TRM66260-LWL]MBZ5736116.1 excalibur calcium-binding domain-containing protein [Nocardioides sp. TRM66260-LWL]
MSSRSPRPPVPPVPPAARLAGVGALLVGLLAGVGAGTAPAAQAATTVPKAVNGQSVTLSLRSAVARLKVATPNRIGYQRERFKHWDDVDGDCQSARAEVLRAESRVRTNAGCTVTTGRWVSEYDGVTVRQASRLDVDHVVPLAEAWASGARGWSAARREAFANDLTDPNTLLAVTASSNRSKGDSDPAEWLPAERQCSYVKRWVTVKLRWSLSVDRRERDVLTRKARVCPDTTIRTHRASVTFVTRGSSGGSSSGGSGGSSGGSGGSSSGGSGGGSSSGTDPRYGTCKEAKAHGYGPYVRGRDPEYAWYRDADGDGIVCE